MSSAEASIPPVHTDTGLCSSCWSSEPDVLSAAAAPEAQLHKLFSSHNIYSLLRVGCVYTAYSLISGQIPVESHSCTISSLLSLSKAHLHLDYWGIVTKPANLDSFPVLVPRVTCIEWDVQLALGNKKCSDDWCFILWLQGNNNLLDVTVVSTSSLSRELLYALNALRWTLKCPHRSRESYVRVVWGMCDKHKQSVERNVSTRRVKRDMKWKAPAAERLKGDTNQTFSTTADMTRPCNLKTPDMSFK